MAPQKEKITIGILKSGSVTEEEVAQGSQDGTSDFMKKKVHNMLAENKKRRDEKRQSIEDERDKRVQEVRDKMEKFFESMMFRVTESEKQYWDRLNTLTKRREDIETQIIATILQVEKQTKNMANEMTAMFEGRLDDLKEREFVTPTKKDNVGHYSTEHPSSCLS